MSTLRIAKAFVVLWSIFSITSTIAENTASRSTSSTPEADNIAGHILHGIGASSKHDQVTVSVPQADFTWRKEFPEASISHARSCWSAYTDWYASYPGYYSSANISLVRIGSPQSSTHISTASSTIWPSGNFSTYKLCDGTPRASYHPLTSYFNSTVVTDGCSSSTLYPTPVPDQPCVLDQADCAVMYFGTNLNNLSDTIDNEWGLYRLLGACGFPLDVTVPCLVQGGPVELMYFPVSTTGGDAGGCANGTTVTPAEEPTPIASLGTTFYPDKVYVSFKTLYAAYRNIDGPGGAAVQIGQGYSNQIFEFRSDEISTNCYASMFSSSGTNNPGYGPGKQLNYADLNYPPPATAYACQNQCQSVSYELDSIAGTYSAKKILPNPCETIWEDFNPLIAVPTKLRSLRPDWASCQFWNYRQANIVFDPPIALTQATAAAKPTLPGAYIKPSVTAMPVGTASGPSRETATAIADNMPTATKSDSGESSTGQSKVTATMSSSTTSRGNEESSLAGGTTTSGSSAPRFGMFFLPGYAVLVALTVYTSLLLLP